MSVVCQSCGHDNPDQFAFCLSCGSQLLKEATVTNNLSQNTITQNKAYPSDNTFTSSSEESGSFVPQAPQVPYSSVGDTNNLTPPNSYRSGPSSSNNSSSQFNDGAQFFTPQTPQVPQTPIITFQTQQSQQSAPPIVPMGTISTGIRLSKVHAFAGRGVIVAHHSWLLSAQAQAAKDLLQTTFDILRRRDILGMNLEPKNLEDHGTQTEVRHYLLLKRSVATIFLYIAPAGNDLYISRVTTALTSIDPFRRFLLIAMLVIGVLFFIIIPISIPIWFLLFVFFIISFNNWLKERDFWIYLRKRELNDFQLDDLSLVEHVTDDTIFEAAKQLKIDSDKLKAPEKGYQHQRRIRAI